MTSARRLAVSGVFLGLAGSAALLLGEGCTGMFAGCEEKKGEAPPPVAEKISAPSAPVEPLPTPQVDMRKVLLGRALFHDKRLSGDGTISCASCHSLDTGGAEHRKTSIGIQGQVGPINAPTVLNSGLNFKQFWDGRADSLEEQALGPVANPIEMGASWDKVVETIRGIENYRKQFEAIYPDGVTQANIVNAIAEYERSLVTPSRFDEYLSGNQHALSEEEQKGWEIFQKVGCISCHRGPNIGGGMFQKMGLVRNYFEMRGTPLTEADNGRYNVTKNENDRHF
ncbi:MAG: cytochrome c peroxidase, partial [Sandaracinaceae bacterium]|nr:cytochrome c peroxidase [Sandaracinaceae bacterium]